MFVFAGPLGLLSLPEAGFDHGMIRFVLDEASIDSDQLRWRRSGHRFLASAGNLQLIVGVADGVLAAGVCNSGRRSVRLREVLVLFEPGRMSRAPLADECRELIHPGNFIGACGVKKVGLSAPMLEHNPEGAMLYMWRPARGGRAHLLSTLPPHAGDLVRFKALHDQPHLEGRFGLQIRIEVQALLAPGKQFLSSSLQHRSGSSAVSLLDRLGRQWAKAMNRTPKPVLQGWNSWDFHVGAVSAQDVLSNAVALKGLLRTEPRYIVIDEGWECQWGRWDANDKFPGGLDQLCQRIRAAGARPGIWTAPLMMNTFTRLYRDHPEWCGRDAAGQLVHQLYPYGRMAFVDPTHPQAARWLEEQFIGLRKAGFEYFKVDFTQEVMQCHRFHDPAVARGTIIRRAFQIIRQAIGPQAYLLACGAPYECVTGLADACRVTGDIRNYWSHILLNASQLAARWWMHRRLWNIDPDFLIVRCPQTCPSVRLNPERPLEPMRPGAWMTGRQMNLRETRAYALLILLSGGDLFLGDDLPHLNGQGRKLIQTVFQNRLQKAAAPLDLFERHGELPRVWLARERDFNLLGLFNWSEDEQHLDLNLLSIGLAPGRRFTSLWDGPHFSVRDGRLSAILPPRSCLGLRQENPRS